MWGMHEGWGWWMVSGWVWFVVFWGTIVWLIAWAVNRVGGGSQRDGSRTALEIAKERLARGEISEEEFQRLKEHLS